MTTREIKGHLLEIYGVEVSPTLVSQVTEAVVADVQAWQNRPLEAVYPIVYFDALWGKVRDNGQVAKVAVKWWVRVCNDNYFSGVTTIINSRKSHFPFPTQPPLTP